MNLVFVSTGIYPNQHAAAIRHSTIAQGVVEKGHELNFFILTPQPWKSNEINYKGVIYKSLNEYHGNNKFEKVIHYMKALKKLKSAVLKINEDSKIDGLVIFSIDVLLIKSLQTFAKNHNIRIFHERTELPYIVGYNNSLSGTLMYNFYMKRLIPRFDGIFVISDKLKNVISSYNKNVEKILTVVDIDFFRTVNDKIYNFPYIAYCGNMESKKDGLPILLASFAQLSEHFPDHKLLLIGQNPNNSEMQNNLQIINKYKIEKKVVFTGFVSRESMPQLLCHADLLVVSKPDNEQNSGNFPIKIGEYLATGVPVVVTNVGEISKFIIDGISGYIAEPGSSTSFYQKMAEALSNPDQSKQIGTNGKKIAENVFNYKIQTGNLISYIGQKNLVYGN
ncbi:MAG TPA: glycosyltransferase family 4 protein [Ignavibacteriaceae bacterium]|nr:glycosyltransferase family 4 protein [Ignavibacteriaceae bacterium]